MKTTRARIGAGSVIYTKLTGHEATSAAVGRGLTQRGGL